MVETSLDLRCQRATVKAREGRYEQCVDRATKCTYEESILEHERPLVALRTEMNVTISFFVKLRSDAMVWQRKRSTYSF